MNQPVEEETDPRIKLPVFEGPMDLLLFLIRKHEIDIYDIPIELVLDQYLGFITTMKEVKIEIAGDFFVMAASLMEIKSRLLLPKQNRSSVESDDEDADIDPRWELVHQLLEYKKFKEAADSIDKLSERASLLKERDYNSVNKAETPQRPLKPEDKISVWNSFNVVLRRLTEQLVAGDIQDDSITVVDQMEMLIEKVKKEPVFNFSSLFDGHIALRTLVTTFIAILELTRLRRLKVEQNEAFCDFIVTGLEGGESLSFEEENELEHIVP